MLDKVDGAQSKSVRQISKKFYKTWKECSEEHTIFRDFIEQERNSILKEYEFGMSEGPIPVGATLKNIETGELVIQTALIEENIYRPMWSGPYEGEDGRTLLDEAILWWDTQLGSIDLEVDRIISQADEN